MISVKQQQQETKTEQIKNILILENKWQRSDAIPT